MGIDAVFGGDTVGEFKAESIDRAEQSGLTLKPADSLICGDAVNPGRKGALALEFGEMAENVDRSFLQHVLGIVVADNNTTDVPINLVAVCTHQQGEALVGGRLLAHQRYYLVVDVFVGHFVIVVSDY